MPIEAVPNTDLKYYLLAFDAEGNERGEEGVGKLSEVALDAPRFEGLLPPMAIMVHVNVRMQAWTKEFRQIVEDLEGKHLEGSGKI